MNETAYPRRPRRSWRVAVLVLVIILVVWMITQQQEIRNLEAGLSAHLLRAISGGDIVSSLDQIVFHGGGEVKAVRVTAECTTLVLIAPLLVISAGFLAATRLPFVPWIVGTATGLCIALAVNALRIMIIAFSYFVFGFAGYEVTHIALGTILVAVGLVGAVIIMLRIFLASTRPRRRSVLAEPVGVAVDEMKGN